MIVDKKINSENVLTPKEGQISIFVNENEVFSLKNSNGDVIPLSPFFNTVSFSLSNTDSFSPVYELPNLNDSQILTFLLTGTPYVSTGVNVSIKLSNDNLAWIDESLDPNLRRGLVTTQGEVSSAIVLSTKWRFVQVFLSNQLGSFELEVTLA